MLLLKNLDPAIPEAIHYPMNFSLSQANCFFFFLIKPVLFGFLSFAVEILLNNREDLNYLWFRARKTKLIQNHGCRGFKGGSVVKNLPTSAGHTGSTPDSGRSHMPQSNSAFVPQLSSLCSVTTESLVS